MVRRTRARCRASAAAPRNSEPLSTTSPAPAELRFGFNDNAVARGQLGPEEDAQVNADVGVDLTRWTVDWRWIETNRGAYDFTLYDQMYRASLARGIRPILILLFSPHWAWEPGIACDQFREDCAYPPGRAHDADWKRFAQTVARRYPEAAGIEVWNEPNLHWFWASGPDPARYAELLKVAYRAVKAVDPRMPVISGGFNNTEVTANGDMALEEFLRRVYEKGAAPYFDVLGFHPYPVELDFRPEGLMGRSFATVRRLRDRYDTPTKRLWVTETGLTRTGTDPRRTVSEQEQADGLVALVRTLDTMDDVDVVIFHTLLEVGLNASDAEMGYGIMDRDRNPKRAYCALAQELAGPYRCPLLMPSAEQRAAADARARDLLRAADAAAVAYHSQNGGSFTGLTSAVLSTLDGSLSADPIATAYPGEQADPAKIGVFVLSSDYVILCNAAETAYCIGRQMGSDPFLRSALSPLSIYAAAITVQIENVLAW